MHINRTYKFIIAALSLLLVPALAEFFDVPGWDWELRGYLLVGVLLAAFGASIAYATGQRTMKQRVIGAALALLILATYVHLAVGLVDWLPFAGS